MHCVQASLLAQFSVAEENLLSSISQGPGAIEAFYHFWSDLQERFTEAVTKNNVSDETFAMAQKASSAIEILATRFIELEEVANDVISSLQHDLDVLFADLNLNERTSPPAFDKADTGSVSAPPTIQDNVVTLAPYIKVAYTWLLSNLHNPYPAKETKNSLARESGSSPKEIDNWFINVRKRIGWNTLRMKRYENKRSKIVCAATYFFKKSRESCIDPTANQYSEFKAIEDRAIELYSDKLFETPLTTKFDGAVDDSTDDTKACAQAEEKRCLHANPRRVKDRQRLSAYPSPERSPERSLEPSPERSPEYSTAFPLPIPSATVTTGRKRRNCDFPEFDIEDRRDEPQKRSRLDSSHFSRDLAVASLPSPAASLFDITQDDSSTPENDCIILPTSPIPPAPSGKRKRRLSDTGNDGPPKRPHNALAVPRLQIVSDPLPLANSIINEWYKTFGQAISGSIPDPVSLEPLDDTQVEVNFYEYNALPDTIQPLLFPSAADSQSPSFQVAEPNFEFQFEPYLNDLCTPQDLSLLPDIPSHDPSTLFSLENIQNIVPIQASQEDILSDPLSYFIPGLSWNFQGNEDSFSSVPPSAGTSFPSNHVPPQVNTQVDPTQNEKEAKLKEIEALRAQLRNLEAEL